MFLYSVSRPASRFFVRLSAYRSNNKPFLIFTGKLSPYLFGFNGFLYRGCFVKSARLGDSAVWDILYWLIWLGINYVFAYTAYKLCCFIHNLRRSSWFTSTISGFLSHPFWRLNYGRKRLCGLRFRFCFDDKIHKPAKASLHFQSRAESQFSFILEVSKIKLEAIILYW